MLTFKKIKFKNLLSYGNKFVEFNLTEASTNLFQGESGSGKSTIASAFCFGLFGKPFTSIRKSNLVNSINNSNLVVEIEFSKGKKEFKIVRGIKPNIFEIYENGKLLNQDASILDYQDFLEKQILKFNMKAFLQISVLGAANFIPFMQLPASERRNIIEEILDIKSFSLMNDFLKQDLMRLNSELIKVEHEKKVLQSEISIHVQYQNKDLEAAALRRKSIEEELESLKTENIKITDGVKKLQKNLDHINKEKKKIIKEIEILTSEINEIEIRKKTEVSRVNNQVKYLESHDNCDFCLQSITVDHKNSIRSKIQLLLDKSIEQCNIEIETGKVNLEIIKSSTKLKTIEDNITKLSNGIYKLQEKVNLNSFRISSLTKELNDSLKNTGKSSNSESSKIIENNKAKLLKTEESLKEIVEERYICELATKLLKDDGIKTDIIKEYLPLINTLVNDYLQKMNFFVTFTLDENFNEQIKSRGRDDFEYACFSEGEKQRLDLAILFTWRSIARLKNSLNTNLLIMDEIADSKLNNEAAENVWEVLKSKEFKNSNVFVISHKNTIIDKFEKVFQFKKPGNFSQVEIAV